MSVTVRPRYSVSTAASADVEPRLDVVDDRGLALHLRAVGGRLGGHVVAPRGLGRDASRAARGSPRAPRGSPHPADRAPCGSPAHYLVSRPEVFGVSWTAGNTSGSVARAAQPGPTALQGHGPGKSRRAPAGPTEGNSCPRFFAGLLETTILSSKNLSKNRRHGFAGGCRRGRRDARIVIGSGRVSITPTIRDFLVRLEDLLDRKPPAGLNRDAHDDRDRRRRRSRAPAPRLGPRARRRDRDRRPPRRGGLPPRARIFTDPDEALRFVEMLCDGRVELEIGTGPCGPRCAATATARRCRSGARACPGRRLRPRTERRTVGFGASRGRGARRVRPEGPRPRGAMRRPRPGGGPA